MTEPPKKADDVLRRMLAMKPKPKEKPTPDKTREPKRGRSSQD